MPPIDSLPQISALVQKAIDTGRCERLGATRWRWDASGKCSAPVVVERIGRPSAAFGKKYVLIDARGVIGDGPTPVTISCEILAPCRKCAGCLNQRRVLWANRAKIEVMSSARTWFGTLTIRPQMRFHYLTVARQDAAARGEDLDALDDEKQFLGIYQAVSRDVTKFLKRLRKNSGANFRYILACERHRSGDPHLHMLLHEPTLSDPVRKADLESCWHAGFSHWRLVPIEAQLDRIRYVTKYLAKEKLTRIRASLKYGRAEYSAEALALTRNLPPEARAAKLRKQTTTLRDSTLLRDVS